MAYVWEDVDMEERTCSHCGTAIDGRKRKYCSQACSSRADYARRVARGDFIQQRTRHKDKRAAWQKANKAKYQYTETRTCDACNAPYQVRQSEPTRTCGDSICVTYIKRGQWPATSLDHRPKPKARRDTRNELRRAWEERDADALLAELARRTSRNEAGCWIWEGRRQEGYGIYRYRTNTGSRYELVHRMASWAVHGQRPEEPVVHHRCAERSCCNPEHLTPVTQRDNIAEMLARNYYERRIAELEEALSSAEPGHPLLSP